MRSAAPAAETPLLGKKHFPLPSHNDYPRLANGQTGAAIIFGADTIPDRD